MHLLGSRSLSYVLLLILISLAAVSRLTEGRRFEKGLVTGFLLGNSQNGAALGVPNANLLPAAALACLRK